MSYNEIIDIVSAEDIVIGSRPRAEIYAENLNCFRVINAFIINSDGKLWIPRRQAHKKLFPLHLDVSVGGHVSAGEEYEAAFIRETAEEVNISVLDTHFEVIGRLTPHTHGTSAFMYVYVIQSDTTPNYNTNDFVESFWLYPHELLEQIEAGEKAKGDLPIIVRALINELTSYKKA